ncbi:MAG: hypothetical protein RTS72_05645 [Candidatus Thorarchaeota archaeon]
MDKKSYISVSIAVLFLILPFLTMAMTIPSAIAQTEELGPWVRTNGPYGGLINCIEIDPTNPDVMYAAGAGSAVFKSINSGASWSVVGTLQSVTPQILDLQLSAANPQVMYARTDKSENVGDHELFMSSNGGVSWTRIDQEMNVFHIALHPTNPLVVVAVMWDAMVYVTDNGGTSWTNITGNLPREPMKDIAISGDSEYWVGVGDSDNGSLYHTTNGGVSWQEQNLNNPTWTFINSIMIHPTNSSIVYTTVTVETDAFADPDTDYLYRTTDGGTNWESLNTDTTIILLAIVPSDGFDTIYTAFGGKIRRTSNDGMTWVDITPPPSTRDPFDIAIDPTDNNTIYLPKMTYGIYKSTNGGVTWTTLTEGLYNTNACLVITSPDEDSETVYVAAVEGTGTFRTDDAGATWRWLDGGGIDHPHADEIRINPHDTETVWEIADIGKIYITNNGGVNWTWKYNPQNGYGFRYSPIHTIETAPSDEKILYAVKGGWGIFRSDDGGQGYDFLAESEVDYSYTLAIHPTDPDTVYSGYNPKVFQDWAMVRKTTDGGTSWETVLNVTGSNGITSVVIDPSDPDVVYAGSISETGGEVYKSIDAGLNWTKLNDNFTMCTVMAQPQLVVNPSNPGIAYAGTWLGGTWKTIDAGATWTLLENAPISATAITMDAQNSDILYLADRSTPTLWKSFDAGANWFDTADFSPDGAFLVNNVVADGDTIYCATFGPPTIGGKLYKSTDAGSNWTDITGTLPRSVLDIAVDPASPEIVYVTTHVKGAFKSVNGGSTWSELLNFPDIGGFDIEVDSSDPTILYCAAFGNTSIPYWVDNNNFTFTDPAGVYKSIDSGLNWFSILNTTDKCRAIRIYPGNSSILYAATHADGIFVSQNSGATWTNYPMGHALTSLDVQGDTIYVGTQGFGVYSGDISVSDYSVTWQSSRSNKPIPEVFSMQIAIDPHDSNRIYVGAYPGGLFLSDDGGATFYDKNFQTPSVIPDDPFRQGYYTFALRTSNTSEIWLGTWGGGMFKSYDAMEHNVRADGIGMTMMGKHIYEIVVSPDPPFTVYAATEEGVFVTEDSGATWINFSVGLESLQVRSLELTANGTLYCGTLGYGMHVLNTTLGQWKQLPPFSNLGNVWPIWDNRPSYQYSTLLFHPTDPNIVYIGTFPTGFFKSTDGGNTWRECNTGWTNDGVFALVNHPYNSDIIYAGTYNGISRSLDEGESWEAWDEGWPAEQWAFSIDFDSRNPEIMYACSKNGENEGTGTIYNRGTVMKSTDGGAHWFEIINGLNVTQEFYKIIVDKHNPDTIYLAAQNDGVFISYDMGESWESWTEGLTNRRAGSSGNNIANPMAQSADGRYLYFGSWGSGVFRRTTYIPPTTTTTSTTPTPTSPTNTPTPTTSPTTGPGAPFPTEVLVLSLGVVSAVVVLVLILRMKSSRGKGI